jgi:hypothetical protein
MEGGTTRGQLWFLNDVVRSQKLRPPYHTGVARQRSSPERPVYRYKIAKLTISCNHNPTRPTPAWHNTPVDFSKEYRSHQKGNWNWNSLQQNDKSNLMQ